MKKKSKPTLDDLVEERAAAMLAALARQMHGRLALPCILIGVGPNEEIYVASEGLCQHTKEDLLRQAYEGVAEDNARRDAAGNN